MLKKKRLYTPPLPFPQYELQHKHYHVIIRCSQPWFAISLSKRLQSSTGRTEAGRKAVTRGKQNCNCCFKSSAAAVASHSLGGSNLHLPVFR